MLGCLAAEENLRPKVAALRSLLGLSEAEVRKLVLTRRRCWVSIEENVRPTVVALRRPLLGLSEAEVLLARGFRRRLQRRGECAADGGGAALAVGVAALRPLLSRSEAEVRKLVLALPQVLGYSVDENLRPTVAALRQLFDLDEEEVRAAVLSGPHC